MPASHTPSEQADVVERLAALERKGRPLDPGVSRRKAVRGPLLASAERFLRNIENVKAFDDSAGSGEGLMASPIGDHALPVADVVDLLEEEVIRPGLNAASGGHLAYIPAGGLYYSALGDYLAAVTNKFAGVFYTGPGAVRMENQLLRWVADLVGYPAEAIGNIASGGSAATLMAVTTARDAHGLTGADFAQVVVYLSDQAHHCIEKALRIAGLGEAILRRVPVDDRFRLMPEALTAAITADQSAGLRPWLVVASAGTTDTGAVDPLARIGAIAKQAGCWFHVDAAYGGFFLLTEPGRAKLAGIESSDSVVLDPHKSLFLPYGIGVVLVKDPVPMRAAHRYFGNYMQDAVGDPGEVSPADVSLELTKHFRALRMWLPLKLIGVAPFRAALDEKLLLAQYFRHQAQALGFEVGPEPDLSIVTFRWAKAGVSLEDQNQLNQRIVEGVRKDGRVFLTSTMIDGRFTIRMAVLAFRTHKKTIDLALRILNAQVAELNDAPTG